MLEIHYYRYHSTLQVWNDNVLVAPAEISLKGRLDNKVDV
jgi:hypothetical protein